MKYQHKARYLVACAMGCITLLTSCTPAEQQYCENYAVSKESQEYSKCVAYYFAQTRQFNADRSQCEYEADKIYPSTLYDNGRTAYIHGGFYGGNPYGGGSVFIEPDYSHNALVSNLRDQIIRPCMSSHGWVSADDWQAGRVQSPGHPIHKNRSANQSQTLPWLAPSK